MRLVVHNHFPVRDSDAQALPVALAWAQSKEPLKYYSAKGGLKRLYLVDDTDQWNAAYVTDKDEIEIQRKFLAKTQFDMVQTLIHEFGHRGQAMDPATYKVFRVQGLDKLPFFLAMANDVHQKDYKENGIEPETMADEIFAESYSRFALNMPMPEPLRMFWTDRVRRANDALRV